MLELLRTLPTTVTTGCRSGSVVLAKRAISLFFGALQFIRLSELRYTYYYHLNHTSRFAPMKCCQSKKRTWQVKGWTHSQSTLPVKQKDYTCSEPLRFDKKLVTRVERLGISVCTVSQSAMNQLWLQCRRTQSPIKSRRRCEESQQDPYH